ncbi:MAG: hypothetical protein V3S41_02290 [Spirochaetia bacterium]
MRRVVRSIAIAALTLLAASAAFGINPENLNRVTFVNNTGYDILYLFFSPGDSEYWGADILGSTRTLDDGEKLGFFIHYPDFENSFDFMAIDEDGDAYFIWDYLISDDRAAVIEITLADYDGGYDMPDLAEVYLTNVTGYDMWYIFLSPGDSSMWGVDMLDDETILFDGDTLSLLVPVSREDTRYDFQGIDEDEDVYEFWVELSNRRDSYDIDIELSDLQ